MFFLLPPSEWKKSWWDCDYEKLSFNFSKPLDIASYATSKDLKCVWERYEEWVRLNKNINMWPRMQAIERYSWVMFKAMDYWSLWYKEKKYFDATVWMLSGMYGLVRPVDQIANYKLPIGTRGLLSFWWTRITQELNALHKTQVVDLLPWSYKKMIQRWELEHQILHVDFFQDGKKLTHAVKWVKWRRLREQIMISAKSEESKTKNYEVWIYEYEDSKMWKVQVVIT